MYLTPKKRFRAKTETATRREQPVAQVWKTAESLRKKNMKGASRPVSDGLGF